MDEKEADFHRNRSSLQTNGFKSILGISILSYYSSWLPAFFDKSTVCPWEQSMNWDCFFPASEVEMSIRNPSTVWLRKKTQELSLEKSSSTAPSRRLCLCQLGLSHYKTQSPEELEGEVRELSSNTYHLWLRPEMNSLHARRSQVQWIGISQSWRIVVFRFILADRSYHRRRRNFKIISMVPRCSYHQKAPSLFRTIWVDIMMSWRMSQFYHPMATLRINQSTSRWAERGLKSHRRPHDQLVSIVQEQDLKIFAAYRLWPVPA